MAWFSENVDFQALAPIVHLASLQVVRATSYLILSPN